MLRQLARLSRPLPSAGPRALAFAVYADPDGKLIAAAEQGYEGVACVDDAARGVQLCFANWNRTRLPWIREWAIGLLDFVLYMEAGNGTWCNFIDDWNGTKNSIGKTSVPGINMWQARALDALSTSLLWVADLKVRRAFDRGIEQAIEAKDVPSDIRALHMSAVLQRLHVGENLHLQSILGDWAEELAAARQDEIIMNYPGEKYPPHLSMHIQEGVLAEAGKYLGRSDLVALAAVSAEALFENVIEREFKEEVVIPYEVYSAVYVMDRLAKICRNAHYADLAERSREWFIGRNQVARPVYDEASGRVADGIDDGRLSGNSGAESNIMAGLAFPKLAEREALEHANQIAEILPITVDVSRGSTKPTKAAAS